MVYGVTDPANPTFTTLLFNEGDTQPEQGIFISADISPAGDALFVVSNEGADDASPSVTIYRLVEPQTKGGNGDDRLSAIAGDDELLGGNGDDMLLGGPGNDRLWGGRGNDVLTTGSGEDIVVVSQGGGLDIVTNFDTERDVVAPEGDVDFARTHEIDYENDGTTDLLLQFSHGGGSLILIGVSGVEDVQFTDLV